MPNSSYAGLSNICSSTPESEDDSVLSVGDCEIGRCPGPKFGKSKKFDAMKLPLMKAMTGFKLKFSISFVVPVSFG